jgi:hypothetical protein
MSLTQDAIKWLKDNPEQTPYAAAKKFGIATSTLYKALKQLEATKENRCPCCGQLIRNKQP